MPLTGWEKVAFYPPCPSVGWLGENSLPALSSGGKEWRHRACVQCPGFSRGCRRDQFSVSLDSGCPWKLAVWLWGWELLTTKSTPVASHSSRSTVVPQTDVRGGRCMGSREEAGKHLSLGGWHSRAQKRCISGKVGDVPRISGHADWQRSSLLWSQFERLEKEAFFFFSVQISTKDHKNRKAWPSQTKINL